MKKKHRKQLVEAIENLNAVKAIVKTMRQEEEQAYDNLSPSAQSAARGEGRKYAIAKLDEAIKHIKRATQAVSVATE
jgi:N-acetylglucosamine kinase-like BadF-type ATPase